MIQLPHVLVSSLFIPLMLASWLAPTTVRADPLEINSAQWPYTAIGKLNVADGMSATQHCTATLIAPDKAVTAAHCLYLHRQAKWATPTSVHFLLGYTRGQFAAASTILAYEKSPQFDPMQPATNNLPEDWAILHLAKGLSEKPVALSQEMPQSPLEGAVQAGYRMDRQHVLSARSHCSVIPQGRLLLSDCGAVPGQSGEAIFVVKNGQTEIVGMVVAGQKSGSGLSLAVPSQAFSAAASR
jgi:protease YdgD